MSKIKEICYAFVESYDEMILLNRNKIRSIYQTRNPGFIVKESIIDNEFEDYDIEDIIDDLKDLEDGVNVINVLQEEYSVNLGNLKLYDKEYIIQKINEILKSDEEYYFITIKNKDIKELNIKNYKDWIDMLDWEFITEVDGFIEFFEAVYKMEVHKEQIFYDNGRFKFIGYEGKVYDIEDGYESASIKRIVAVETKDWYKRFVFEYSDEIDKHLEYDLGNINIPNIEEIKSFLK